MKNKLIVLVLITTLLLLVGCSKRFLREPQVFWGITKTNEEGDIISADPDDWRSGNESSQNSQDKQQFPSSYPIYPIPTIFKIGPAYPNPATGQVRIECQLPASAKVCMFIVNEQGKIVRKMMVGKLAPGYYLQIWDIRDEEGNQVPPGIYRCYFQSKLFESHGDIEIK
ncbi:MAG: FlgD immunoglobulin-like domain containing protein [Candidatus Edwardsbacteria bacterium]